MLVHQSDIGSWSRCPQAYFLERAGNRGIQTSALAFGNVVHHCVEVFEQDWRSGNNTWVGARDLAVETFKHYWHPLHIDAVTQPVELWLPHQSFSSLARIGVEALTWWANVSKDRDDELLATEFGFQVPIVGTWDYDLNEPHILAGTLDRLSFTYYKGLPILEVGDYKTGKDYPQLRQNVQFSAYCYATTRPEFWCGWRGEDGFADAGQEMYQRFSGLARRGTWISLKSMKVIDAGWRGPADYTRFALAVDQVVASIKADIFPLSISGENCTYCTQRTICGGVGVPDANHGAPGLSKQRLTAK